MSDYDQRSLETHELLKGKIGISNKKPIDHHPTTLTLNHLNL